MLLRALSVIFLFLSACTWSSDTANQTVIQVNDHKLSAKEFSEMLARQIKGLDALSAKDPNQLQRSKDLVSQNFIFNAMIVDYAKTNSLVVEDAALNAEIDKIRGSYPDDLSFRRVLAQENISFMEWKDAIRVSMLSQLVFKKVTEKLSNPTNEEIRRYYADRKEMFKRKDRIYLRQIVTDDLSKAQSIKEDLRKRDFADMAKKYSVAPEAKAGGLVGWIEKGSVDIFDKAFLLPVGGVSQVLESPYGFHIFKVERKAQAGYASVEEVNSVIVQALKGQREQAEFSGWLDKQIRASRVLKNTELIRALIVETRKAN